MNATSTNAIDTNAGNKKTDALQYIFAVVLGVGAGIVDVRLSDLLVTAVFVMIATMMMGLLRPSHAWRWMVIVAACVPLVQLAAHYALKERFYSSHIYLAFSGFLTGTAGAYAGAFARMGIDLLMLPEKPDVTKKA
jgi:hypothetical protein